MLFQNDFNPKSKKTNLKEVIKVSEIEDKDINKTLLKNIIDTVEKNIDKIDKIITELAPEWPLDNISKLDLSILRIAIAEGFILNVTPQKVVINEAIELSKEFSNDQTRKFISGVLGNLFENHHKYFKNVDRKRN